MSLQIRTFSRMLAVAGAFMFLAVLSRAQGAYASDDYDGIYFYTDLIGYPPDDSCSNSISVWSSLGGDSLSGYSFSPNTVDLPDSIYANPGDYGYDWGFTYDFVDPLLNCNYYQVSYSWPVHVGLSTTYYTTPQFNYPDANGYCYYWQDACINGSFATIDETVYESTNYTYRYNAGTCTSLCPRPCPEYVFQNYGYAIVNGGQPRWVRFGSGEGGPASCT